MPPESPQHKSGYVAIIGEPNAGKSTLLNRLLDNKISIATHKPQTTRHQIIGIHSDDDSQIVFLDTPGIITPGYELQSVMMRFVERAKNDADVVLLIADGTRSSLPEEVLKLAKSISVPVLLVINKLDQISQEVASTLSEKLSNEIKILKTHTISALNGDHCDALIPEIKKLLLPGPPWYPKDMLSEQPMRFFVAELIREQVFLLYHEEIPYSTTVEVIQYEEKESMDVISANIVVNRKSQKGILIGKGGQAIKTLGTHARESVEAFTGRKAYLDLHVKVREKWREKENWVRSFGYR